MSWAKFLSKIHLTDEKHLRNYYLDYDKKPSPIDLKDDDREVSDKPENKLEEPESREQLCSDLPKGKIDIDIVNFSNKQKARVTLRMTRNRSKKKSSPEYVDLDEVNTPTSFATRVMLDLKDQPPPSFPIPSEKAMPENNSESKSDDDCKNVECKSCFDYEIQVQSLKDDVSELHREILKLRR